MDKITFEAIQSRLDATTPGSWDYELDNGDRDIHGFAIQAIVKFGTGPSRYGFTNNDAEFIANAPNDIAWLLGTLEEAWKELGKEEGAPG